MPRATGQPARLAPVDIAVLVPIAERHGLRPGMSQGRRTEFVRRRCRWDPRGHGWGRYHARIHAYAWIALHGLWFGHGLVPARSRRPEAVVCRSHTLANVHPGSCASSRQIARRSLSRRLTEVSRSFCTWWRLG